jgi:hypothetical protein
LKKRHFALQKSRYQGGKEPQQSIKKRIALLAGITSLLKLAPCTLYAVVHADGSNVAFCSTTLHFVLRGESRGGEAGLVIRLARSFPTHHWFCGPTKAGIPVDSMSPSNPSQMVWVRWLLRGRVIVLGHST